MQKYILLRFLFIPPLLLGISLIMFLVSHVMPGDPAALAAGRQAAPEQIAEMRRSMGLDEPLPTQYWVYLQKAVQGDLGISIYTTRPVLEDLRTYLPASIELAIVAMLLAIVVGVPLGVASGIQSDRLVDHIGRVVSLLGISMPVFWIALLCQLVFYKEMGLFPRGARIDTFLTTPDQITGLYIVDSLLTGNWDVLGSSLKHIVLPAVTLSLTTLAHVTRMTRSSLLEVMGQDYIRTARAKGLAERAVIAWHAMKNALNPVVTIMGLQFGHLISRAFLVEVVFSWPGIGQYAVDAIFNVDYYPIMGAVMVIAVVYMLVNLMVDLLYGWLDPRVRYA